MVIGRWWLIGWKTWVGTAGRFCYVCRNTLFQKPESTVLLQRPRKLAPVGTDQWPPNPPEQEQLRWALHLERYQAPSCWAMLRFSHWTKDLNVKSQARSRTRLGATEAESGVRGRTSGMDFSKKFQGPVLQISWGQESRGWPKGPETGRQASHNHSQSHNPETVTHSLFPLFFSLLLPPSFHLHVFTLSQLSSSFSPSVHTSSSSLTSSSFPLPPSNPPPV